ncbi:MAG: adenylate/guanylate cyclase domain-containing protein [Verrucomicrobia bacterium]|nr:adenylate/guanylate cyclase domain-containing protein [Verrucomicrobiota bacterium]
MWRLKARRIIWQAIVVFIGVTAVWTFSAHSPYLIDTELRLQDILTRDAATVVDDRMVLLALDEPTLTLDMIEPEEIQASQSLQLIQKGFPFSRAVYAEVLDRILNAGAKVVVVDVVVPKPREGDEELATILQKWRGRVVLGSNFDVNVTPKGPVGVYVPPLPELAESAGGLVGYVTLESARDAVIRNFYPYATLTTFKIPAKGYGSETPLPALSTLAASVAGKTLPQPPQAERMRFSYLKKDSITRFSLYEVLVPALWQTTLKNGAVFKDKVVLIGATAGRLQDFQVTPLGSMSGPDVHLNIISAILRDGWYHSAPQLFTVLSVPLSGFLVFLLAVLRRRTWSFLIGWLVLVGLTGFAFWLAFVTKGLFLPAVHPLVTLFLCGFGALAVDVAMERRERVRLRSTLDRYVSRDVVREIVDNPDSYLHDLGGQRREIVALFCDLKGFTSEAESMEPAEMVALLNEYFTEMTSVIFAQRGTLDKFMGDALLASWGGLRPEDPESMSKQAVQAALEMKDRLREMNSRRAIHGVSTWESGTGICLGPAVFGNIGSREKMDPTVIGDTVNLASRIEALTRIYGCDILLDERVAAHVQGLCPLILVDVVRVKGRKGHSTLWHPSRAENAAEWAKRFDAARVLYVDQQFAAAMREFSELARDPFVAPALAECYRQRCEDFLRNPPAPEWDGVWEFLKK